MRRAVVIFTMLAAMVCGGSARAEEEKKDDEAGAPGVRVAAADVNAIGAPEPAAIGVRVPRPSPLPRRARTADPWFTRATMSMTGATASSVNARIPTGDGERTRFKGSSQAASLGINLYGRWLGFDLALAGAYDRRFRKSAVGEPGTAFTAGEARASFTGVVWNSRGVFLAVGPSVEGRATAIGSLDQGNEGAASWQSAFAGPVARARVFVGPRVYATAHVFAGVQPLGGAWQAVDAAEAVDGEELIDSGTLRGGSVLSGTATIALRPVEWFALSGGAAWRTASYRFEGGASGAERNLRPFVGFDFLY